MGDSNSDKDHCRKLTDRLDFADGMRCRIRLMLTAYFNFFFP